MASRGVASTEVTAQDDAWATPRRAALIANARARNGKTDVDRARALLQDAGIAVEAHVLGSAARLPQAVRAALEGGHDFIIVGGGDGSISAVVDVLAHRGAVLGVLPLGTANDFARTLHIPLDLDEACRAIASGHVAEVDLGCADGAYYVNVASIGLGADVVRRVSPAIKRIAGTVAYPIAAVQSLLRCSPFSARLSFPAGDHETVTFPRLMQVAVGNGRFYGGGMVVAPDADVDSGTLDVYAIEWGSWRELAGVALTFKDGEFVHRKNVYHRRTPAVRIETEKTLPTNVDGELVEETPVDFSLARHALKVVVPATKRVTSG